MSTAIKKVEVKSGTRWEVVLDDKRDPKTGKRRQVRRRFRTRTEAKAELARLTVDREEQVPLVESRETVGAFLERWLTSRESSRTVSASTLTSYRQQIENHVLPRIGGRRLRDITAADLDALYAALLADGRLTGKGGLSARTVLYIHGRLKEALDYAVRHGHLKRNPADHASPPSNKEAKAPESTVWTPEELRAFLGSVGEDRLAALWRSYGLTGVRRGEALGLLWDSVDLDAATLTVRRQLTMRGYNAEQTEYDIPKTERSHRVIDLDPSTVAVLRAHKARQAREKLAAGAAYSDHGLVFAEPDGEPLSPSRVSSAFERAVKRSKLPRVRLHDLRHSHATHLLAAGQNPVEVSRRLGHTSVNFTMDRYGHVLKGRGAEGAAAVAAMVDGV